MKIRFTLIAVALSSALMAYYFLGSKQSIKPQSPSAQAHQFYQEPANSQATAAQRNLGFTSLTQEVVLNNLTIQGTMPSWLNGTLLRMGPGQFDLNGKSFGNFFDGFGMVHKFSFCNGTISYANKFIETKYRTKALKRGSLPNTFQEREKSSWLSAVGKLFTKAPIYDNANINVSKVGNEFVAITETPYYKAFNLATLDSKKVIFQDKLDGHLCTAHPLTDQKTGETFNILTQYGNTSNYHIYKLEPGSYSRTTICSLTTKYPSYIHSFGMTDQYIIMVVIPFVVNPMDLMFSNKAFIDNFVWKPENKTELIIINRHNGKKVGTYAVEPFFFFHIANCFEQENNLYIDMTAYTDYHAVYGQKMNIMKQYPQPTNGAHFKRIHIDTATKNVHIHNNNVIFESPRINEQYLGKSYSYIYGITLDQDAIVKYNPQTKQQITWHAQDCFVSEAIFVPRPNSSLEDDGVLLSVVLDSCKKQSFLLILNAHTMKEVARATLPHIVPFDFHGNFYS